MTRITTLIALTASAALAACNSENHNIVAGGEPPDDMNVAANADVHLPPSIMASKIYRCADNKVVYVDWLSDNKSANIRTEQGGSPTLVTAPEAGKPMAGPAGFSLEGNSEAGSVKIGVPGHPSQSCKA